MYEYKCGHCGFEFEDITSFEKKDDTRKCPDCSSIDVARKQVSSFAFKTTVDPKKGDTIATNKEIDKVIGEASSKRWEQLEKRRNERWKKGKQLELSVPRDKDGQYKPMSLVGTEKQRKFRKEFSEALSEHRKERSKKGLKQFDGPGSITD
jgi:putative FmdB family regulatory protein